MANETAIDPVQAEVDSINEAELYADCAAVLDVLATDEGLTVREIVGRLQDACADFSIDAEARVDAALRQLRADGCAEYASWSSAWWSTNR